MLKFKLREPIHAVSFISVACLPVHRNLHFVSLLRVGFEINAEEFRRLEIKYRQKF